MVLDLAHNEELVRVRIPLVLPIFQWRMIHGYITVPPPLLVKQRKRQAAVGSNPLVLASNEGLWSFHSLTNLFKRSSLRRRWIS